MKGSNGVKRRTRNLRVKPRDRGKVKIRQVLSKYEEKDNVSIHINPSQQNIPHPRFNGRVGKVVGSQGRAYFVEVQDGRKTKKILVTPEHLKRLQ